MPKTWVKPVGNFLWAVANHEWLSPVWTPSGIRTRSFTNSLHSLKRGFTPFLPVFVPASITALIGVESDLSTVSTKPIETTAGLLKERMVV